MALPGSAFEQKVNTESTRATYSGVVADFTPAATATDIVALMGAEGKTVTLISVRVTGSANAAGTVDLYMHKYTSQSTGGTSAPVTVVRHDTADSVVAATMKTYSVNPTALGTGALLRGEVVAIMAKTALGSPLIWDFANRGSKAPKINSSEAIVLNWNGQAVPAGTNLYITFEWTEE